MNIEQAILNNLRILPPEKQQLLLEFTEFLKQQFITKGQTLTPQEKPTTGNNGLQVTNSLVQDYQMRPLVGKLSTNNDSISTRHKHYFKSKRPDLR